MTRMHARDTTLLPRVLIVGTDSGDSSAGKTLNEKGSLLFLFRVAKPIFCYVKATYMPLFVISRKHEMIKLSCTNVCCIHCSYRTINLQHILGLCRVLFEGKIRYQGPIVSYRPSFLILLELFLLVAK